MKTSTQHRTNTYIYSSLEKSSLMTTAIFIQQCRLYIHGQTVIA